MDRFIIHNKAIARIQEDIVNIKKDIVMDNGTTLKDNLTDMKSHIRSNVERHIYRISDESKKNLDLLTKLESRIAVVESNQGIKSVESKGGKKAKPVPKPAKSTKPNAKK